VWAENCIGLVVLARSTPTPINAGVSSTTKGNAMRVQRLLLFIHAPAKLPARDLLLINEPVQRAWCEVVETAGAEEGTVVCIIQGSGSDTSLVDTARRQLGERCILDPEDDSPETRLLLVEDMERGYANRGNHGEWSHYELWSSNNARRWSAGLKKEMRARGFQFDPTQVVVETFGNWTGCHHKYSNFLACYLGLSVPARIHSQRELCGLKDFPFVAAECTGHVSMDCGVELFLFVRADGCPMAQFWDGLRPVWQPPHLAEVGLDPDQVDLFTLSPNAFILPQGGSRKLADRVIADVGDGAHSAFTTLVGSRIARPGQMSVEAFGAAVKAATITVRQERAGVYSRVEV
jgi:hypothetical protein